MRAPFDRFIDTFFGVNSATPLDPIFVNEPARLVLDQAFVDTVDPLNQSVSYLTFDAGVIAGPPPLDVGGQLWLYDFGKADLVALTSGGPITHQCARLETRTWFTGGNYYRAHLIPRSDVEPSLCSSSYPPVFEFLDGAVVWATLYRIGPTSWYGDGWLLLAEVTGPPGAGCNSTWRIYRGSFTWVTTYNGLSNAFFVSADGGTPTAILVHPVP